MGSTGRSPSGHHEQAIMGVNLPDLKAEGPKEKRSFKWMIGFSVAAVLTHYGRVAFVLWGRKELAVRYQAAGTDELKVGSASEFLQLVRLVEQLGWALLMVCCLGFLISAVFWIRALKTTRRSGTKG